MLTYLFEFVVIANREWKFNYHFLYRLLFNTLQLLIFLPIQTLHFYKYSAWALPNIISCPWSLYTLRRPLKIKKPANMRILETWTKLWVCKIKGLERIHEGWGSQNCPEYGICGKVRISANILQNIGRCLIWGLDSGTRNFANASRHQY